MEYKFRMLSEVNKKSLSAVALFFFPPWLPVLIYVLCIIVLVWSIQYRSIVYLIFSIIFYLFCRDLLQLPVKYILHRYEVFLHVNEIQFPVLFSEEGVEIFNDNDMLKQFRLYEDIVLFGESKRFFLIISKFRWGRCALPILLDKNTNELHSDLFKKFILSKCNRKKTYRKIGISGIF